MDLQPRILEGRHVRLEPVREGDRAEMRELLESDRDNWLMQTANATGEGFEPYWRAMIDEPGRITLAIRDAGTGALSGTSSFFLIDGRHRTLEIGYTFFHPRSRGTAANPETKLLMLGEAFAAGALRVQFTVSAVNARSRAAVLKLGAKQEGILRRHRISWTGERRDTVMFSIIDEEWDEVRERLQTRLAASPS
jgi:RimJ/RimL family protein N-acetyltransferase